MPPLSRAPTQEIALLDQVERFDRFREGRLAVQINLSLLSIPFKREDYIRVATESFAAHAKAFDGQLFVMENTDIVFIAKDTTQTALDAAVERLRVLFKSDPLIENEDTKSGFTFCTRYDVEHDYHRLLDMARNYMRVAELCRMNPTFGRTATATATPLTPIHPEILGKLEQALAQTDVTNMVRRQTVCTLVDGQPPQPLFEELFVSIDELQKAATPGVDLCANRWLFQYLTRTLDRRVLLKLMKDTIRHDMPFSLNLNIETVLSPEFMQFETTIPPKLRGKLVIELHKLDVFADMTTFLFARDYLRDHGFRLCLDGLTHHTLSYYDSTRLGFDLFKIYWTPDSLNQMSDSMIPDIRNVIMESGQARTILCRCENQRAVDIGQQLGIVMFEGRYVESLYNASRNTAPPKEVRILKYRI